MEKVAIIIVTYNGKKYLPNLLGSIFNYLPKTVSQEIIVVDNNSADGSIEWLENNYPQVILLTQIDNLGFAKANNLGIQYALSHNFNYVMLLNQDTIVTEGYLDKLVEAAGKDDKIAAVQPKILLYPETELINSAGNVIHYLGFGYTFGHKTKSKEQRTKSKTVNYCSGAACLIKVEALKKVGLFNEDLFMYHEDLDLGWRFRMSGYQNVIAPEATVYHQYEFSRSIKKYYFMERNRFIVIFQNYKLGTIFLILPSLILMEIASLIASFINGWWLEKLKVYLYFLQPANWSKILNKRRLIQAARIKGDREVALDFSGKIEHQEVNSWLVRLANPLFNFYWQVVKKLIIW